MRFLASVRHQPLLSLPASLIRRCSGQGRTSRPVLSLALMFFEKGRWVLAKNFWAAEFFLLPLTSLGRWEPLQALDALRY